MLMEIGHEIALGGFQLCKGGRYRLRQNNIQFAVAERQGLRQQLRRPEGAWGHLLHFPSSKGRMGPAARLERRPVEFFGRLPSDGTHQNRHLEAAQE